MTLSSKGNVNFDFQSTISDENLDRNKILHACPKNCLFTSEHSTRSGSVRMKD